MSKRMLLAFLSALIVSSLIGDSALAEGDDDTQLERASSNMYVNTPADDVERDGALSLREALMLADGSLSLEELGPGELDQVIGIPGPHSTDLIKFDRKVFPFYGGPPIYLHGAPLPPLAYGFDTIDARFVGVKLVGGQTYGPGLYITSNSNLILGITMVGFSGEAITIADGRRNQIRDVQLHNNRVGIYISGYLARDNLIRRSDIESNREAGVWFDNGADRNRLVDSDLKYSYAGVRFGSGTDHNVVAGNDISANTYGVLVERGADHNDFDNDRFRGNQVDVEHR